MSAKCYYPSPDLHMALYHLQNHPEDRAKDPKRLAHIPLWNGRKCGRSAWARAKNMLATYSEPRDRVEFDTVTHLAAYIGNNTRVVTLASSRPMLLKKIAMVQIAGGYQHVYTSPDKRFYIYERPAAESRLAA